jgi:hypothetical protein
MSAAIKVSKEDVLRAIQMWRGNVVDAARWLRISPTALYKRLASQGITTEHLNFLRRTNLANQPVTTMPTSNNHANHGRSDNHANHANHDNHDNHRTSDNLRSSDNPSPKNERDNYRKPGPRPILLRMTAAGVPPIPVIKRARIRTPRLLPEQVEQLWEMKLDFNAKYRTEATEEDLLQRFFDECFADWLEKAMREEEKKP